MAFKAVAVTVAAAFALYGSAPTAAATAVPPPLVGVTAAQDVDPAEDAPEVDNSGPR